MLSIVMIHLCLYLMIKAFFITAWADIIDFEVSEHKRLFNGKVIYTPHADLSMCIADNEDQLFLKACYIAKKEKNKYLFSFLATVIPFTILFYWITKLRYKLGYPLCLECGRKHSAVYGLCDDHLPSELEHETDKYNYSLIEEEKKLDDWYKETKDQLMKDFYERSGYKKKYEQIKAKHNL